MAAYLLYLGLILVATTTVASQNILSMKDLKKSLGKIAPFVPLRDRPSLVLYYESMCPECRKFYTSYLLELVTKLGPYMDINTLAYGKAATILYYNSSVSFWCQHGEAECYGNKLQECSVVMHHVRKNQRFLFISCLMDFERSDNGSNDVAVVESFRYFGTVACKYRKLGNKKCISKLNLKVTDTNLIKGCAKGDRGTKLLEHVAWPSLAANYTSVPHILVNGNHWTGKYEELMKDICATFTNPPEPCKDAK